MSNNISAWSIKTPVPTIVLFLVLTIMGLVCFPILGIDARPNIDIPSVSVTVTQVGADPAELETQVTKKIEDSIASLGNIDHINSTINDGVSTTRVDFILGTNSDRATNDVRNAVSQIRQNLPQDINEPIIKRLEFSGAPIMYYAVSSDRRSVEELSDIVDRRIARELLSVPGVAQIPRSGGVDREVRIDLNPDRLQSLGITATQVNDQIRSFNINLPGGRTNLGDREQSVRTIGSALTVEDLRNYQIVLPKGSSVPLSSLGEITNGFAETRQSAHLAINHPSEPATNPGENLAVSQPVVAFSILRSTGSTLVTVEEGVQAKLKELQKVFPDIKLELIFSQADHIRESYQASIDALIIGAVLAVVTILIFLRDWRSTLITAVALPLSVIPTFAVLRLFDYTLNYMTMLALSLVVGILVDDAIVEIENIERHMQMGKTPFQAAIDASDEIGLAVVATTMSIVAVFMPVAFMSGITGQFFRPFGVTVVASVLFSLLVARTVTPMMAAYLLKNVPHDKSVATPTTKRKSIFKRIAAIFNYESFYRQLLTWALRHRLTTIAISLLFFIGSLMLVPHLPMGLFGSEDIGYSSIAIELPPGSTLQDTETVVQQVTNLAIQSPAVESILATEKVGSASVGVKLKPVEARTIKQGEFEQQLRPQLAKIPGARISFASMQGIGNKDLSIVLKSENPVALNQTAEALTKQMQALPGLVEVTSSASLVRPEILIKPDPNRAADQGVSVQTIARTAYIATLGDTEANLPKFDLPDGRQIPIRIQLDPKFHNDIETIKNLQLPAKNGSLVPLISVADVSLGSGPSQIDRLDRSRKVSIESNLQGVALGEAFKAVRKLPAINPLPPEVVEAPFGNAQLMRDLFSNFGNALSAAVLFIYTVLVLLFSNFLHPLTIMVSLPLSLGGALLGLLIGQQPLGLFALIGIVLLIGLVSKNSILLVDYTLLNQREGKPLYKAVVESGVSRLRPILMTTIAMIAGMMPIALGIGAGSEVRSPMAIAVIGGLITSTLLTLVAIPVIYTYMDGLQSLFVKRLPGKH